MRTGYKLTDPRFMFTSRTSKSTSALLRFGPVDLNEEVPFPRDWQHMSYCVLFDPPFDETKKITFDDLILGSRTFQGLADLFEVKPQDFEGAKKVQLETDSSIKAFEELALQADNPDIGLVFLDKSDKEIMPFLTGASSMTPST